MYSIRDWITAARYFESAQFPHGFQVFQQSALMLLLGTQLDDSSRGNHDMIFLLLWERKSLILFGIKDNVALFGQSCGHNPGWSRQAEKQPLHPV